MVSDAQTRPSLRQESLDLSRWRLKLIGWPLDSKRSPVLLIPGHLCPHNFWLPPKRNGFGDWLWEHNFRPFALSDPGASERFTSHPRRTSDWVFHIIPRAIDAIYAASGKAPHVVGYSAGAAYALACQALLKPAPKIASLAMVGTQVTIAKEPRWVRGALRALGRLSVAIDGRWLGLPASGNSAVELSEYLDLKAGDGELSQPLMHLRSAPCIDIAAPVLSLASAEDNTAPIMGSKELFERIKAPDKSFVTLAQSESQPAIEHFEFFARRHRDIVWPHLLKWLKRSVD